MTTNRSLRAHAIRMSRRFSVPVIALSLVLGVSGIAGALFSAAPTPQTAAVTAAVLAAPTGGSLSVATSSTLSIEWTPPVGYAPTGYEVLRCTGASCTPALITSGSCATSVTAALTAPNCADNDLALMPYTIYTYQVIALFNHWFSPPSASFSAKTLGIPTVITSASSVNFVTGTAGSFTVTTTGIPSSPTITNADFSSPSPGCTISTPLAGVTFTDNGDGTATIASTSGSPSGTMILCLNATNGVAAPATQVFTLTIGTPTLTFTDASGANVCTTTPKFVIPAGGMTLYVSRSFATSSVSVGVVETVPAGNPGTLSPNSVMIPAGGTLSAPISVGQPGSNNGVDLTASAPGYAPVTCEIYKNP